MATIDRTLYRTTARKQYPYTSVHGRKQHIALVVFRTSIAAFAVDKPSVTEIVHWTLDCLPA